jgi:DNA-binding CsgD family transcriptional regulator
VNDPTIHLSEGQKNCLRLVAQGMSSKEIAKQTGLTPQTVDTYLKASLPRLGASNRREAARLFLAWEAASAAGLPVDPLASPSDPAADSDLPARTGWNRLLNLPPLGGKVNDLGWAQKTVQALQVAVVAAATIVALTLGMAGILKTFS